MSYNQDGTRSPSDILKEATNVNENFIAQKYGITIKKTDTFYIFCKCIENIKCDGKHEQL